MEVGDPSTPAADDRTLMWLTIIHLTFIVSAVGIAFVDRLSYSQPATGKVTGH